ncbi:cysteine desulfurase family protein [Leptothoe sp. PORK10 BA2]|uniref:cysteine desulfurase family protein n=1 Tax=Leptothoe sp. PORK10 BA2 TaxID=3110254 RepID=UPI002B215099|nr:cysteine desulfurase family protein [Leptothoe sp. PORK10 BA2]MEA5462986.1 cysteine desulfurase family protein [Leptothoe sp. PORK10 BA2]
MQIYLDYSATTPPRPEVIAVMGSAMTHGWGNPSSLHSWGSQAATVMETARMQVAELVGAPGDAIAFTASGTEANNLAIMGVAQQYRKPRHIIISAVEHSAITQPAKRLEQQGWHITQLPVDHHGQVNPTDLAAALCEDTVLVSVIYGQSEVGTLQPIAELAAVIQARRHQGLSVPIFHSDAVQVAGRLPIDVEQLGVDLLSISSHKLYGPQGAGALYVKPGTDLVPLIRGGGQENNLRSGTQAVPTIAGFGLAAQLASQELLQENQRLLKLRNRLIEQVQSHPELVLTGHPQERLPHHVSFYLPNADGERVTGKALVRQLNMAGIGISAGSACHSGTLTPSPILKAMGFSDAAAKTGIRLTLGHQTTEADVDWAAMVLRQLVERVMVNQLVTVGLH